MRIMLKNILQTAVVVVSALPFLAFAQGGIVPVPIGGADVNIQVIITRVMSWAFGLLLVLAAAFIFYAGFTYLTASGDEAKLKSAKNYILYAVVAIVVAFLAQAIIAIVRTLLGVQPGA